MLLIDQRIRRSLVSGIAAATLFSSATAAVAASLEPGPEPTVHTQEAFAPEGNFTAKWTRADARQIKRMSDPRAVSRQSSMPAEYTMPSVPQDFPDMSNEQVWVWDSWPLTDANANQYSVNGQEIIFSLVADRNLGFDDRHVFAKIGYFYRPAGIPANLRPANGGWTYGGLVFDEGVTGQIFEDQSYSHQTQWSGSARIFPSGEIKLFFTDVAFYRDAAGKDIKPYDPKIALSVGKVHANKEGVKFTGFDKVIPLLSADGTYYQTGEQNPYFCSPVW